MFFTIPPLAAKEVSYDVPPAIVRAASGAVIRKPNRFSGSNVAHAQQSLFTLDALCRYNAASDVRRTTGMTTYQVVGKIGILPSYFVAQANGHRSPAWSFEARLQRTDYLPHLRPEEL